MLTIGLSHFILTNYLFVSNSKRDFGICLVRISMIEKFLSLNLIQSGFNFQGKKYIIFVKLCDDRGLGLWWRFYD